MCESMSENEDKKSVCILVCAGTYERGKRERERELCVGAPCSKVPSYV